MKSRRTAGFTIVELLLAASVFIVVLGGLGALFVSSNRASNANRDVAESAGQVRSAIQAIQYDVSLAGYKGVDANAGTRSITEPVGLQVAAGGDGQSAIVTEIYVRYFEDRYVAGAPTLTTVRYRVSDTNQLLRRTNGGEEVPLANGVEELRLLNYRRTGQNVRAPGGAIPDDLTGFDFQIAYTQGRTTAMENFSVRLVNR